MNQSIPVVSYSMALKNYNQNGRGRSMRKFCEDEGYDYNKFMQFARKGQKELSVLMDADSNQSESSFIPLVVESGSSGALGIAEVRVRFTNGMELIQNDGDINELFSKSPKSRTENPSRVNTFAMLTKRSSNGNVKRVLRSCNVGVQVFSWQAQPEEVLPG